MSACQEEFFTQGVTFQREALTQSYRQLVRKTDILKRINELIERAKTEKGVTKKDLAEATGVRPGQFLKYRKGTSDWPLGRLEKLADELGISLEALLFGEERHQESELHRKLDYVLRVGPDGARAESQEAIEFSFRAARRRFGDPEWLRPRRESPVR